MAALIGFTLLLVYLVAGELLALWFDFGLPGPVIGMLLMWPSLSIAWVRHRVQAVADFLLANLSLLFIPVGVGVILHIEVLRTIWWQVTLALVLSTVLGLATTTLLLRWLMRQAPSDQATPQRPLDE